jgi:hypothetical protein
MADVLFMRNEHFKLIVEINSSIDSWEYPWKNKITPEL